MSERDHESAAAEQRFWARFRDSLPAPYGGIQWKGTSVCIDLHCVCGAHWHDDAEFLYAVRCPECGVAYAIHPDVRLVPVTDEEAEMWLGPAPARDNGATP